MIDQTEQILADLNPAIQEEAWELINAARLSGIPLMIISGRRTAVQNRAVGGAPLSRHLSGRAFDVQVLGYSRDQLPYEWWRSLGGFAELQLGLRWGGRFLDRDVNHFDR